MTLHRLDMLMGPAHAACGAWQGRQRRAFHERRERVTRA
jgi:hypothetical protein